MSSVTFPLPFAHQCHDCILHPSFLRTSTTDLKANLQQQSKTHFCLRVQPSAYNACISKGKQTVSSAAVH